MLKIHFNPETGIVIIEPNGALTEADFVELSSIVDPYLQEAGELKGLIIHVESFPGWDSFGAMVEHVRFVRDHHRKLSHVALVTDSSLGSLAEKLAGHFVAAEIRHFDFDQLEDAKSWILAAPEGEEA